MFFVTIVILICTNICLFYISKKYIKKLMLNIAKKIVNYYRSVYPKVVMSIRQLKRSDDEQFEARCIDLAYNLRSHDYVPKFLLSRTQDPNLRDAVTECTDYKESTDLEFSNILLEHLLAKCEGEETIISEDPTEESDLDPDNNILVYNNGQTSRSPVIYQYTPKDLSDTFDFKGVQNSRSGCVRDINLDVK